MTDIVDAPTEVTFYIHVVEREDGGDAFIGRWEWAVTRQRDLGSFWKAHVPLGNWGFGVTRKSAIRQAKRRARHLTNRESTPPSERPPKYERYVFTKEI